jgi:choline monooxygenase
MQKLNSEFAASHFSGPIEGLTGLPNVAYVSDKFAVFERDEVLAKTWTCVGNASQLRSGGWLQPVDLLGLPLLLVRDRDNTIRVFHNVCSHRGLKLVEEARATNGIITCRYHGWCYGAGGELRRTPHIGGEGVHTDDRFDMSHHGLREIRSQVFAELIFVNLSGDAPKFESFIQPVTDHWKDFDFNLYKHGGKKSSWRLDLDCNWKLAQENHVDGYHLPFVHPGLNSYSPLRNHYPIVIDGSASGQGSIAQGHAAKIGNESLPKNPALGEDWQKGRAEFLSVFPNVMIGVQADHLWVAYLLPVTADRTEEYMDLYYVGQGAIESRFEEQRINNCERMFEIFKEDKEVVEGMQRGRQSPAFQGGALSPALDQPAHCFNKWMAASVQEVLKPMV